MRVRSFWAVLALTSALCGSSAALAGDEDIRFASASSGKMSADDGCCDSGCGNGGCGSCRSDGCIGNWRDNMQMWLGGDAYKSIGDAGLAGFAPLPFALGNSFGAVGGLNTAFRLGDSRIRAQVGGSLGLYDFAGRTSPANASPTETQGFVTAGLYKRSDICCGDRVAWGVVYDKFYASKWGWGPNSISLGQIRGTIGYALNECNEVGLWGTIRTDEDTAKLGFPATSFRIRATNQLNGYLAHNWELGATTAFYLGVADQGTVTRFVTGLLGQLPLNDRWSAYGNMTYVASQGPGALVAAAQEQWNIGFGLMYSFGGKARSCNISGQQGLPLLSVANNGSFLTTQQ